MTKLKKIYVEVGGWLIKRYLNVVQWSVETQRFVGPRSKNVLFLQTIELSSNNAQLTILLLYQQRSHEPLFRKIHVIHITILLSRMMGAISNPSIVTLGIFAPARLTIVGKRSSVAASCQ